MIRLRLTALALLLLLQHSIAAAQVEKSPTAEEAIANSLDTQLKAMSPIALLEKVQTRGSSRRGALLFYQSAAACVKCHLEGEQLSPLGPKLTSIDPNVSDEYIVNSMLYPSRDIREGFETAVVLTVSGEIVTGLIADERENALVLRDAADLEREIVVAKDDIESFKKSGTSMMPDGLISALRSEREFYDLARYVLEVARGGEAVAAKLKPSPAQLVVLDDTVDLDHAGILSSLSIDDFEAGQRIYASHCVNCHGADGNTPTLATARAFGSQAMKFGSDPFKMLGTLTRGNGLMGPMQHLSPRERYQAIYYIREQFMKGSNPGYIELDAEYLATLPTGTSSGEIELGNDRDFGPVLASQLGAEINSALTFRLPGQVAVNYDLHRFRLGGVWQGGFLDLSETQHYRQRGERMPAPDGTEIAGLVNYGWQLGDTFEITSDGKPPRGPVRDDWAKYFGHYLYGDRAIMSYAIHGRAVLETISAVDSVSGASGKSLELDGLAMIEHTLRVDAGDQALRLVVGQKKSQGDVGVVRAGETAVERRNAYVSQHIAVAANAPAKVHGANANANVPRHVVTGTEARRLDLGNASRTIVVRFRTQKGGTLIASAPETGDWVASGKTLFVRGGKLVFDIGWVGALNGQVNVADGKWHTAALHVEADKTRLFVDGKLESEREQFRRDPVAGHLLKVGATATNFGGDFEGDIPWATILEGSRPLRELEQLSTSSEIPTQPNLWAWIAPDSTSDQVGQTATPEQPSGPSYTMVAALGDTLGMTWEVPDEEHIVLTIPPSQVARVLRIVRASGALSELGGFHAYVQSESASSTLDLADLTHGGERRWPQELTLAGTLGESVNGYALDTLPVPFENPWNSWMRTSALDFFPDGRCVVTTHGGDVYIVSGIDADLEDVTWTRYASGLFEPFGVRVVNEQIYVTCRDGLKRLHDYDDNSEADFVEAFWNDDDVSSMFHAYNFDLQTDSAGNFYFAKAGQYTKHHRPGTIMQVPPEGGRANIVAWGLRTPNGMGKLNDDRFTVSDNQGPWMPAGKISLITPNAFLGNMPINDEQDAWLREKYNGALPTSFDEPFIWMPQELDSSCGGQVWSTDERWGPLAGRLIHSSFGKGWLYYLSLQTVDGKMQSSIVALPHQWDAGVMRLRVNPADGQMYGTGLSGWQGPEGGLDGCLQRLRYTGEPVQLIDSTRVVPDGLELTFNVALGEAAMRPEAWNAEMWDYLWSRQYGSDQFSILNPGEKGRDQLRVSSVQLSNGNRTAKLTLPQLSSCDQLRIEMELPTADGGVFVEEIYLTIHNLVR